jgi:hypothetical protein
MGDRARGFGGMVLLLLGLLLLLVLLLLSVGIRRDFILVLVKLHQSASLAAAVWVHKSNQKGKLRLFAGGCL